MDWKLKSIGTVYSNLQESSEWTPDMWSWLSTKFKYTKLKDNGKEAIYKKSNLSKEVTVIFSVYRTVPDLAIPPSKITWEILYKPLRSSKEIQIAKVDLVGAKQWDNSRHKAITKLIQQKINKFTTDGEDQKTLDYGIYQLQVIRQFLTGK